MLVNLIRTSISKPGDHSGLLLLLGLALTWLLACQVAFYFIQYNQGIELSKALQAQFRSDLFNSDFEYLARTIGDLEALGTIRCPRVEQINGSRQVILDLEFRGACINNSWLLMGGLFETPAQAANGDQYVLRFSTSNQTGFIVGLWAMRIGGLILLGILYWINRMRSAQVTRLAEIRVAAAQTLTNMASQVSHDIRSPLSALNMVVASLKDLPEDKRLIIRSAAQRINDIANGLLQQSKKSGDLTAFSPQAKTQTPDAPTEPQMLVALLDAIVSEKRIQYRERLEIEILADLNQGYGLFTHVHPAEFVRVISNLVNNAVEAMPNGLGERVTVAVTVAIRGYKDQVAVIVSDNGKGIPADVLARLGERGVTHGKEGTQSGSGLGVSHARETVERAGGKFSIQSQVGVGTQVTLTFPRAETPKWFVEKILIQPNTVITSLDDDQTIHQLWADRLSSAGSAKANVQHVAFSSLEQFMTWAKEHDTNAALFLVDYEFLAQAGNGLDAIEQTGIASRAILVTSRHEEPHVRARAEALSVRVLPKALAPLVPLAIENS
jgi:signal transduction histidine kinase